MEPKHPAESGKTSAARSARQGLVKSMVLLVALSCAASPSPTTPSPDTTPAASGNAPAQGSARTAETGAPMQPAPNEAPRAKVTKAEIVAKDQYYKRATVAFENPSPYACNITSYTLKWEGGKKEITLDAFSVPPGESRQRSVRVHADDGDLGKLLPESAQVEVHATCRR
jgi:hypothetical protein